MATHKAEADSHSSNSAENTNSQSHKLPMTITIHSAGASPQSSNYAENTNTKANVIHYTHTHTHKTTKKCTNISFNYLFEQLPIFDIPANPIAPSNIELG